MKNTNNVLWHHATVTRKRRQHNNGHKGCVIWFTGLSGSGKSTLAHATEEKLHSKGCKTFVLDGDNIRHGLSNDLGFSNIDRSENIRRIGEISKLFVEAGIIVMTAFISPIKEDRDRVKSMFAPNDFLEIFCDCPLDLCIKRDVKGLYKRAIDGEIKGYTGISSPYEQPDRPDQIIKTGEVPLKESVDQIIEILEFREIITC